jgi:hypothetical protein
MTENRKSYFQTSVLIIIIIFVYVILKDVMYIVPCLLGWFGAAAIDKSRQSHKQVAYNNESDHEEYEEQYQKTEKIEEVPDFVEFDKIEFRKQVKQLVESGGRNID